MLQCLQIIAHHSHMGALGMRRILFGLFAALMTTTALAKGGPPTVTVEFDFVIFSLSDTFDPREAGQLLAQCSSEGTVDMFGLHLPCMGWDLHTDSSSSRVITFHIGTEN